jgi:hypothetical protein
VVEAEAKYMVCREEVGAGGTPHLQGYMYFASKKSLAQVKKMFPTAHFEAAKGTGDQNRTYCIKDGNILVQRGDCPQDPKDQAKHGVEYWDNIKRLATDGDLDEVDSKTFVTLYNQLTAIKKAFGRNKASLDHTCGEWWYGPSGSGKSRTARELYPNAFIKGMNKWWDGYRDEEVVILEDIDKFNVSMGGDLKRWLDHYSFPAEVKGGGMNIRPTKIIITSQYRIAEIWDDAATQDALERRCLMRPFPENEDEVEVEPIERNANDVVMGFVAYNDM